MSSQETAASARARVWEATPADAAAAGRLLHDFSMEYGGAVPSSEQIAGRLRELVGGEGLAVLLGGDGPDGVAVLRFQPSIWGKACHCYLADLYIAPRERGKGLGRALMEAAVELARSRRADRVALDTGEKNLAARGLYESLGFENSDAPGGPVNYLYELKL